MIIQQIEPIYLMADYTFYKSVQNIQPSQAISPSVPAGKKAGIGREKMPQFSGAALKLREMDQQMGQIEKAVSSVKEELNTMRRTLPPFPPGSQERVRILKSYIGLRKLIEQLTVPPDVTSERYKGGIDMPELSGQATDGEVDAVLLALDKIQETIQEKRASFAAGAEV
jgi:hypothetical protein